MDFLDEEKKLVASECSAGDEFQSEADMPMGFEGGEVEN